MTYRRRRNPPPWPRMQLGAAAAVTLIAAGLDEGLMRFGKTGSEGIFSVGYVTHILRATVIHLAVRWATWPILAECKPTPTRRERLAEGN